MRATTQLDVAKAAGVSQRAVASVVGRGSTAKGSRVSEETRRLILEAAARLNYRPHLQAQIMRGAKSRAIGMIRSVWMAQYHQEKAFYATDAVVAAGYTVFSSDHINRIGLESSIDRVLDSRVEGVLLIGFSNEERDLPLLKLKRSGVPTVALPGGGIPSFPSVITDHSKGMYDLVAHLKAQGHRNLMHTTLVVDKHPESVFSTTHRARAQGFLDGVAAAGLPEGQLLEVPGDQVFKVGKLFDRHYPGKFIAAKLLENRKALPDAVLCSNDDWAVGVIGALTREGVKLPEELALTGFDGASLGDYLCPRLTTIRQPSQLLAQRAVDLLFRLIGGETLSEEEHLIRIPGELVVRESCQRKKPVSP